MKGMKGMMKPQRMMLRFSKHELMIRRAANHNAHVITPHGKIQGGRKGRKD